MNQQIPTAILAHAQRSMLDRIAVTIRGDDRERLGHWQPVSRDGDTILWQWAAAGGSLYARASVAIVATPVEREETVETTTLMESVRLDLSPASGEGCREVIHLDRHYMVLAAMEGPSALEIAIGKRL